MTPKEKSQQLIYAFEAFTDKDNEFEFAKQCALIAVDEILHITCLKDFDYKQYFNSNSEFINYWQEVKTEIENL
jgi:hypothetical protein